MFNHSSFYTASMEALIASFQQIRPFLLNQQDLGQIETKADDTLLTIADHLSENAGFAILRRYFPDVPIIREESGLSDGSADWQIWYDPIDGTAAFTVGAPTSTVICAAYDTINKSLLAVAIGEPAYKRIWLAAKDKGCRLIILDNDYNIQQTVPKKVWSGDLDSSTAVFLDLTRGFTRDKGQRKILSDKQIQGLVTSLALEVRLQLYGSNGIHQALVANGNEKVVGGITTAMGGPWDAAGALLVKEAGGVCQAWKVIGSKLQEADYLDPVSYDVLVYANNEKGLKTLATNLISQNIPEGLSPTRGPWRNKRSVTKRCCGKGMLYYERDDAEKGGLEVEYTLVCEVCGKQETMLFTFPYP